MGVDSAMIQTAFGCRVAVWALFGAFGGTDLTLPAAALAHAVLALIAVACLDVRLPR